MALPATLRCTAVNLILLRMQHTDRSGHQHEESKNHRDHQHKIKSLFYAFFAKKTAATMLSTVMVLRVTQISASANRTIKMIQTKDIPATAKADKQTMRSMSLAPDELDSPSLVLHR